MSKNNNNNRQPAAAAVTATETPDQQYKVGPGCPPKEYQFKPGQSGNPKGAKRKQPSMALDLKAALERALNKKIKLKQGENERLMSMGQAGIEQLVTQFAKGDRHARRDLITLADRLGVDLLAGQKQVLQQALADNHRAILDAYFERRTGQDTASRVFAPAELLDDDPEHPKAE
jgi:uncharacterized protein (DUF2345 family)